MVCYNFTLPPNPKSVGLLNVALVQRGGHMDGTITVKKHTNNVDFMKVDNESGKVKNLILDPIYIERNSHLKIVQK